MAEKADELNKLISIATDLGLNDEIRIRAIEGLGNIGTKEALRALWTWRRMKLWSNRTEKLPSKRLET